MKVLFIDSVHPLLAERLTDSGYECDEFSHFNQDEILAIIDQYDGAVIRSKFKFDQSTIDKASKLKFIARSGAGMENIDLDYARKKNIICFNSPEGNRDAVAEHAMGMLLMLFNHLQRCNLEVKKGIWKRESNRGIELKGKTVGIIGVGVMGKAFAQRLSGFDCKIIGYDRYNQFKDPYIESVTQDQLFEQTDIVSLHTNYLPENHHYFNTAFIDQFKKPFYLINTARGNCVKTNDLVEALKSDKILGACLDVLEYESTSFEQINFKSNPDLKYLIESDRTILSPHVAGWTRESYIKLSSYLADKIIAQFGSFQ